MANLRKTLGVVRGTALMLNIVLGAGLLTLPGLAFRELSEDAIWIWVLCALLSFPLLIVFAIVGRNFPDAGGIPALLGQQFGRFAYTIGTFLFFGAVLLGLPGIAITGGYYAADFIGASPYLLGALLLLVATLINFLSAELAGRVNGVIASLLIFVLLVIVVLGGISVFDLPDAKPVSGFTFQYEITKYTAVFMMVFFAFTGWEVAAHLSEEFRNPKRDVPIAMGLSFFIAVFFYLSLAFVVGKSAIETNFEAPFSFLLASYYGPSASWVMSISAVMLIFANLSAAVWAVSRMVVSASRESLLPEFLANTRNGTPVAAVLAVLMLLFSSIFLASVGFLPLHSLLEYAGQNFLILYGLAAIALFYAKVGWKSRLVAALAITVVLGILISRDGFAMIYPAVLVVTGISVSLVKSRRVTAH